MEIAEGGSCLLLCIFNYIHRLHHSLYHYMPFSSVVNFLNDFCYFGEEPLLSPTSNIANQAFTSRRAAGYSRAGLLLTDSTRPAMLSVACVYDRYSSKSSSCDSFVLNYLPFCCQQFKNRFQLGQWLLAIGTKRQQVQRHWGANATQTRVQKPSQINETSSGRRKKNCLQGPFTLF